MMKQFLVKINAYGYRTNFDIEAIDTAKSIEAAILDKIGKRRYKVSLLMVPLQECVI
jgi:hypothetical protein